MSHSAWTVMEGVGKESLETIAREVTYCNEWKSEYGSLRVADETERFSTTLAKLGHRAVDPWLRGDVKGSLHEVVERLDEGIIADIAETALAQQALDRLMARRFGELLGFEGMRARIYVAEDGVSHADGLIMESFGVNIQLKKKLLNPGDVIEGQIRSFSSHPRLGGRIGLKTAGLKSTTVQGLVDPVTAEHRVELDIFHKARRKHQ